MKSTTVYLHNSQHQKLHELAEELGIPLATFVRVGVDIAIERAEARVKLLRDRFGTANLAEDRTRGITTEDEKEDRRGSPRALKR